MLGDLFERVARYSVDMDMVNWDHSVDNIYHRISTYTPFPYTPDEARVDLYTVKMAAQNQQQDDVYYVSFVEVKDAGDGSNKFVVDHTYSINDVRGMIGNIPNHIPTRDDTHQFGPLDKDQAGAIHVLAMCLSLKRHAQCELDQAIENLGVVFEEKPKNEKSEAAVIQFSRKTPD